MRVEPPLTFQLGPEDTMFARPAGPGDLIRIRVDGGAFFFDITTSSKIAAVLYDSLGRALKPRPITGGAE